MTDYFKLSKKFEELFKGEVIIKSDIEEKINKKHKVYKEDVEDALGDPCIIVVKPKQKSPQPKNKDKSEGVSLEIYAETSNGKILFIFCRLFPNGNIYLISAYWTDTKGEAFYYKQRDFIYGEE